MATLRIAVLVTALLAMISCSTINEGVVTLTPADPNPPKITTD